MKITFQLEELAMLASSIFAFSGMSFSRGLYHAFILAPDLSILGYMINTRTGAFTYNSFHHKWFALMCFAIGSFFSNNELMFAGIILFGHSSIDRIFGYELKYPHSFQHAHLGWIGKIKN